MCNYPIIVLFIIEMFLRFQHQWKIKGDAMHRPFTESPHINVHAPISKNRMF